ncbi:Lrp/AsnC ligand binding domain-containing protein [Paenibacillus humicus]|uniref:Lrp/AsnC ligand binding domain-containing protein n=1 Tax=Paenibacillus humicus TaxID=412861 RepID=UPI0013E36C89
MGWGAGSPGRVLANPSAPSDLLQDGVRSEAVHPAGEVRRESPDVAEMHQLSGPYNFMLKVQTRSMASLEAFQLGSSTLMRA